MKNTAERLFHEEHGQDLIEYALLAAVLGIGCITGILQLSRIREFFALVSQVLRAA